MYTNSAFSIGLDRYLTSGPDESYDNFCEATTEAISDNFFDTNEDWIIDSDECNKLLSRLFKNGKSPKISAAIIERYHSIYLLNK